jgi:hypothetical protein
MMRGDFRLFGEGSCEWGVWEDNTFFDDPNDRGGACVYFDAWANCSAMQFRVWHIHKDLKIEIKGEGFNLIETKSKFYPDDDLGEENTADCGSYCSTFVFQLTKPQGNVEVVIPSETLYFDDECSIRWDEQYIYDMKGRKAHLEIKSEDHYEIKEILTNKQKQHYALEDRCYKLKSIARKMNRYDLVHQLDMAWIAGDFRIE